jgi:hypothetical protein
MKDFPFTACLIINFTRCASFRLLTKKGDRRICEVAKQTQKTKGLRYGYYHVHDCCVLSD